MVNRLSPDDAMYYFLDRSGTTTHLGALLILDPAAAPRGAALDYAALVALVENRLQLVPRYRQVVTEVTLGLARPLWVDDRDFDITFHIRRSALPQPGDDEALSEFIARVMSRPLDRHRPLWEMYLIEGLPDGRIAILTKTHRCLLDEEQHLEISEVITDETPEVGHYEEDLWMPGRPPGSRAVTMGALAEAVARPGELVESVFSGTGPIADLLSLADQSVRFVGNTVQQLVNAAPDSPLNTTASAARLFTFVWVPRTQVQEIAERFECSFNDVVLAVVTGVMRRWTLSVKDSMSHGETVRAVLPLGAREPVADERAGGGWICEGRAEFITDLPVGEDSPSVRLMQVAGLAERYSQSQRRMTPGLRPLLPELGVVPFADVSTRVFNRIFQRSYNVPIRIADRRIGCRYVNGVPVRDLFTVPPLLASRALAISVNEYCEKVEFAFLADRNVLGDLPAMAGYVLDSIDELATGGFEAITDTGAGPRSGTAGSPEEE